MPFETPDLLPTDGDVPDGFATSEFVVRPLTLDDAETDFEAVTESRDRIRGTFGPDTDWPSPDLTLAQNRIDVAWHQKEFQRRDAFTYAVMDPDEAVELGCIYVQPTRADGVDAAVYFWVSASAVERGVAADVERRIRDWIADAWPFDTVAYPGRDVPWPDWEPATTT